MNDVTKRYAAVFERALEKAYAIGPFDSEAAAEAYADNHHRFPQIWRVIELKTPES